MLMGSTALSSFRCSLPCPPYLSFSLSISVFSEFYFWGFLLGNFGVFCLCFLEKEGDEEGGVEKREGGVFAGSFSNGFLERSKQV